MLVRLPRPERKSGLNEGIGLRIPGLIYLGILTVVPIVIIFQDGFQEGFAEFWHQISLPIARHAIFLTLWTSLLMTVINAAFGLATAYALVRLDFPGKRIVNVIIDLPLAIPTLVTGVMLVTLYGPQNVIGTFLQTQLGIRVIFAPPGIILAMLFITFPFVVRAVQPVLEELDSDQEDAAATLGASSWIIFWKIILPGVSLPLLSGALLAFARAVGEFGSVVIVAGNIPLYSQVASVYVLSQVESENRLGASAVSIILMVVAFGIILISKKFRTSLGGQA